MKKIILLFITFGCCFLTGCGESEERYTESSEYYEESYEDDEESWESFQERVAKMLAGIKDSLDLSGEPIGCYISEDSTIALILEQFYEDESGEYGKAHVYRTNWPICSSNATSYCGRLTYQGAGSYAFFCMAPCSSANSVIILEGGHGGNIYELYYREMDFYDCELTEHTLYSIDFRELLAVCAK